MDRESVEGLSERKYLNSVLELYAQLSTIIQPHHILIYDTHTSEGGKMHVYEYIEYEHWSQLCLDVILQDKI